MLDAALRAEILRLYHAEHWRVGTIARQLGVHHSSVECVLTAAGVERAAQRPRRRSLIDPYLEFIAETLQRYPTLTAARLYDMVKERGYPGGPDNFRHRIAALRPRRRAEAYLRLRTLPGEQSQADWGHFDTLTFGRSERPLMGFFMVLSYSRQPFLRFYPNARLASLVHAHVAAFTAWGGVARTILYDNMKSVVLERRGDAIRFHPTLLALAAHYHFEPRPVAVARGNEKGRVERLIRFARDSFFAGRRFRDLDDLNAQAAQWCATRAAERPWPQDKRLSVAEAFEAERARLLPLPDNPFPSEERVTVTVGKTPYARYDGNDYSVPHDCVGRSLCVLATLGCVRVLDGSRVLATHRRSFERGAQIEDPAHLEALIAAKRGARAHRALDRLHHAAPRVEALFTAAAARGDHLATLTRGLIALLDTHGPAALERAIAAALDHDAAHLGGVRHFIDQQRPEPALPLALSDDPRLRAQQVRPHDLADYEQLHPNEAEPDDHDDDEGNDPAPGG